MENKKIDGRKNNGGKSTKSKKSFDRRKRVSVSDTKSTNAFFDNMKEQIQLFYESTYKEILDKHVRHGDYYVYFHYFNDEIVYIGKGKGGRVLNWNNRTSKEHSNMLRDGLIKEVIASNNLTEDNALLIEGSLITTLKPIYNTCKKSNI